MRHTWRLLTKDLLDPELQKAGLCSRPAAALQSPAVALGAEDSVRAPYDQDYPTNTQWKLTAAEDTSDALLASVKKNAIFPITADIY